MFDAGTRVRRVSDPGTVGIATGHRQQRTTHYAIEVTLPDGFSVWWHEHHVEVAPVQVRRDDAFASGRFGRVEDLRRTLMIEKIRGDLTDVFYSMGTSDTDFYPHQFKPVLRFVESVNGRLLIADEVGLGKTIEALLIWKELEAREQARRLLVICPALLREKWCDELKNRFRIRAEIVNASQLVAKTDEASRDGSVSFALVGGYEALRPARNPSQQRVGPRTEYTRLLEANNTQENGALYDLVIVDEAHYARNHETATNRLVRALNAVAANLVFLTATPIQLNDDNLFQLLRMVDPDRFGDPEVFARLIVGNEPIVRAYRALLNPKLGIVEARDALLAASSASERDDPVLTHALQELSGSPNLSPERRVALARSVERISVLATTMVRSRKRDVLQNRVIRDAKVIRISLSPHERRVYDAVTNAVIKQASRLTDRDTIGRFALITRQRQMASSINAALRVIGEVIDIREELFEDFGNVAADETDDDLIDPIDAPVLETAAGSTLSNREIPDSKLDALKTIIRERLAIDPAQKFVLFSYFRATLSYLSEKLQGTGITCHILQGGMGDAKWETIKRFRDESGPAILLSSEVGSEGIDLQFCRILINYDLPWNPMKVEQRIGRIDRLGQKAERILIFNFVIDDTIEERMLLRLYERIGVFERSLGDIEQILGEDVYKLVLDLFKDGLTDEQKERQAELNIQAIVQRTHQIEDLEAQASNLVAFTDYILDEVREGRDLGRYIEPDVLWTVACELLAERYPGTYIETVSGHENVWRLQLSPDARADMAQYLRENSQARQTRLAAAGISPTVTSDPRWNGTLRPAPEIIDATHPLILWLRNVVKANPASVYPVSAIQLPGRDVEGIARGSYIYAIDRFGFRGLRREAKLCYGTIHLDTGQRLPARDAEQLVHAASRTGSTLPALDLEPIVPGLVEPMRKLTEDLAREYAQNEDRLTQENSSLCDRQLEAIIARRDKLIAELKTSVAAAEQSADPNLRRTIPLRQAVLRKASERFDQQVRRIEQSKLPLCDYFATAAGFIVVV
jgi:superfamily II DNA or RNA helicase